MSLSLFHFFILHKRKGIVSFSAAVFAIVWPTTCTFFSLWMICLINLFWLILSSVFLSCICYWLHLTQSNDNGYVFQFFILLMSKSNFFLDFTCLKILSQQWKRGAAFYKAVSKNPPGGGQVESPTIFNDLLIFLPIFFTLHMGTLQTHKNHYKQSNNTYWLSHASCFLGKSFLSNLSNPCWPCAVSSLVLFLLFKSPQHLFPQNLSNLW